MQSPNKTLLMLAYHFPPDEAIGGARPFRFYKYLPRFGVQPVVTTAAPQDHSHPLTGVHYVPDPFLHRPRSVEWHVERILRRFVMLAEVGLGWSRKAAAFCNSHILPSREHPVVLYSTFPPVGTHLAALQIVHRNPICWIADFRDPYVTAGGRSQRATWISRLVSKRLERAMIHKPALMIVNTEAAAAEWISRYPEIKDKIRVIPNGFDPSQEFVARELPARARKTWIHTGALYGGRHAGPILASLDRLIRSRRLDASAIHVRLIGECNDRALIPAAVIESATEAGWLEIHRESVRKATATAMAADSEGLMLLQPHSSTQVPGKLFEYIRLGRPILGLIRRNSPIEEILAKCGIPNICVFPDDAPGRIDDALMNFYNIPSGPWKPSPWFEQTFSAIEQTSTFCSLIDEALAVFEKNSAAR